MGEQRFKVGDWVRVKDNRGAPRDYKMGEVRQVTKIDDDIVRCGSAGMFDYRFEPWQPRVGERVRVSSAKMSHKSVLIGREFKVTHQAYVLDDGAQTWGGDNAGGYVWRADELEPILTTTTATPEQPATLKIEAGKFYKTRDGRKVGPSYRYSDGWSMRSEGGKMWLSDGKRYFGGQEESEIIDEWIDEPAAKASNDNAKVSGMIQDFVGKTVTFKITQPKYKVGDRVKCLTSYPGQFTAGKEYVVSADHFGREYESVKVKVDDAGSTENGWLPEFFELVTPTTTIVALIENGQPKPSSTPHVHATTGAAEKEAKRLAAKFKGQQFGVFTLTTTHHEQKPVYDHKWQNLAALGLKIDSIKELRAVAGLTLKGAKDAVEAWINYQDAA